MKDSFIACRDQFLEQEERYNVIDKALQFLQCYTGSCQFVFGTLQEKFNALRHPLANGIKFAIHDSIRSREEWVMTRHLSLFMAATDQRVAVWDTCVKTGLSQNGSKAQCKRIATPWSNPFQIKHPAPVRAWNHVTTPVRWNLQSYFPRRNYFVWTTREIHEWSSALLSLQNKHLPERPTK